MEFWRRFAPHFADMDRIVGRVNLADTLSKTKTVPATDSVSNMTPLSTAVLVLASLFATGLERLPYEERQDEESDEQALSFLIFEGPELDESLRTHQRDKIRHLPRDMVLPKNPHVSSDDEFVRAISGGGSQGRLGRDGIRSALYAIYAAGEVDLGIYGLEAESDAAATRREQAIREIWAVNIGFDRVRIHRKGLILVVIWHDGVPAECWNSVNETFKERLDASEE